MSPLHGAHAAIKSEIPDGQRQVSTTCPPSPAGIHLESLVYCRYTCGQTLEQGNEAVQRLAYQPALSFSLCGSTSLLPHLGCTIGLAAEMASASNAGSLHSLAHMPHYLALLTMAPINLSRTWSHRVSLVGANGHIVLRLGSRTERLRMGVFLLRGPFVKPGRRDWLNGRECLGAKTLGGLSLAGGKLSRI